MFFSGVNPLAFLIDLIMSKNASLMSKNGSAKVERGQWPPDLTTYNYRFCHNVFICKVHSTTNQNVIRVSRTWNKLPENDLTDTAKIKAILVPFYTYLRDNHFNPNDTCTGVLCCHCPRCRPWGCNKLTVITLHCTHPSTHTPDVYSL